MDNRPKTKGERSEAIVLAAFLKAGKVVLIPFGNNQRYDLVIEENGTFTRIQVKTGRLIQKGDVISFNACSCAGGKAKKDYRGQADLFAVYCPDTEKVYLVPVEDAGLTAVSLRLTPVKNGLKKKIRYASEYEMSI